MTTSSQPYGTVLRDWDVRSGVRVKPRVMWTEPDRGSVPFPRSLTPAVTHSHVRRLGPAVEATILTTRLYLYLDFTRALEQEVVNPILLHASRGLPGIDLPRQMRVDAHRIYVDEGYHALAAVDLSCQVEAATGVPYAPFHLHRFQHAVRSHRARLQDVHPGLVMFCAAVVSETLISGTLAQIPTDPTVASVVRHLVADHAEDERGHHAYFAKLHEFVWPRLTDASRRALAPLFGDFIIEFLSPDLAAQAEVLTRAGLGTRSRSMILHDSYGGIDPMPDIRRAARATLRLLGRTGVLDLPGVLDHYAAMGLVGEDR